MSEKSIEGDEPMENEDEIQEEVEFDPEKQQEWEELKKGDAPFRTLKWGQENGVPQSELESIFAEVVERERKKKSYGIEYNLRKSLSRTSSRWGSPEDIEALGVQAYQEAVEADDIDSIKNIALDVYGKDSPEYLDAFKRRKELEEKVAEEDAGIEEEELVIKISSDATLADLFRELTSLEEVGGPGSIGFQEELHDNFDKDLVEKILDFDSQKSKEKVIDFFDRYGCSKEDIEIYLPIKFV